MSRVAAPCPIGVDWLEDSAQIVGHEQVPERDGMWLCKKCQTKQSAVVKQRRRRLMYEKKRDRAFECVDRAG
jgi:hypothetical protein